MEFKFKLLQIPSQVYMAARQLGQTAFDPLALIVLGQCPVTFDFSMLIMISLPDSADS